MDPAQPGDHVRIGSGTKTFTATSIMKLVEEGKVNLDDTLAKWLPGVMYNFEEDKITVRHLLNHTSGIDNIWMVPSDWLPSGVTPAPGCDPDVTAGFFQGCNIFNAYCTNTTQTIPSEEAVAGVNRFQGANQLPDATAPCYPEPFPDGPPRDADNCVKVAFYGTLGEEPPWNYANTNYYLLGDIIEAASGLSYTEYLHEELIGPLGLENTFTPNDDELGLPAPYAEGYLIKGWCPLDEQTEDLKLITQASPALPGAAGLVISNMGDMVKWVRAIAANPSTLLTPPGDAFPSVLNDQNRGYWRWADEVDASLCPPNTLRGENPTTLYGLGNTLDETDAMLGFMGHRGQIVGYDCSFQYWWEHDISIVACASQTFPNADCSKPYWPEGPVETANPVVANLRKAMEAAMASDN